MRTPPVILDTGDMWQVFDLDDKSRLVRAQAGVTGPQLRDALAEQGWRTGHEPQSIEISTVGGWIATRACGQLSARFGGIGTVLAGFEAVLPSGEIVRSKVVPRRAAGPDVASLIVGSEGTLGVVTEATLRVVPLQGDRVDRCLHFSSMAEGVSACRRLAQSELQPTLVRLYDAEDAALFLRHHQDSPSGPLLLLSFEGPEAEVRADRAMDHEGAQRGDEGLVAHWWTHRNDAVSEFRKVMEGESILGSHGIVDTMEVAGTWEGLRTLYHSMKERLSEVADLAACHISHVYPDGACLYFTLASACEDDAGAARLLETWWTTGMDSCLEAGGSISHHHGIGRLKAPWLERELGGWYPVLKAVKRAIDPAGIMNPGVLGL
jgi:alkyldihydroxyacetonephosphate synthase